MRIIWVVACGMAAWDCADRAVGLAPQAILAPDNIWIWWLPAFAWTVVAIRTAMGERG